MRLAQDIHDATYFATAQNLDELKALIDKFERIFPTKEGLVFYAQNKMHIPKKCTILKIN